MCCALAYEMQTECRTIVKNAAYPVICGCSCQSPQTPITIQYQAKQLTRDQYAANHPAGRIGKRLTLRVVDLMLTGAALPVVSTPQAL